MNDFYERVAETIREHDRMVLGVPDAGFSYTIGNYEAGLPELLILGIDPQIAKSVLNAVSAAIQATAPRDGDLIDIGGQIPVRLRALEDARGAIAHERFAIQAGRYYGHEVPLMQVMVPDPQGRYPDEPDCDPRYVLSQVLVCEPNA